MDKLEKIVLETKIPNTKSSLVEEFYNMGLKKGDTVLVHSSLSSIGYVVGGAKTVVEALMEVITEEGNIVMPTHTCELCDPVFWSNPQVPNDWFKIIREELPAFDPKTTKTNGMGEIVESFRIFEGVKRSYHPLASFAAWGKDADFITENHSLENSLGEKSPLARVYDLNGKIILLGVEFDRNTSCHLGEYRAGNANKAKNAAPILVNGEREFKIFDDIEFRTELFHFIFEKLEEDSKIEKFNLGNADVLLVNSKDCVDYSTEFFKNMNY